MATETTFDPVRWIASFIEENSSELYARPWSLTAAGVRWTFSTDGRRLAAVPAVDGIDEYTGQGVKSIAEVISWIEERKATTRLKGSTAALLEWSGRLPKMVECNQCRGLKEYDCPCCEQAVECGYCNDDGLTPAETVRKQVLEGVTINAILLARSLDHAPSGICDIYTYDNAVAFVWSEGRLILMGIL